MRRARVLRWHQRHVQPWPMLEERDGLLGQHGLGSCNITRQIRAARLLWRCAPAGGVDRDKDLDQVWPNEVHEVVAHGL